MKGHWHLDRHGVAMNEGGERAMVLNVEWAGPLAPFIYFAVQHSGNWHRFSWQK